MPGDTLASALVANGVKLVGRSFKYHRPRGILTAGSEEPNALVELRSGARREPNTKATTAELYDGLEARSQNRWPSLRYDLLSVNQLFSPIFVAGFYYKTFMWPAKFWEAIYEPAIRRAAGLGRAAGQADPDHYDKAWAHCDVLVAGGGPAGLVGGTRGRPRRRARHPVRRRFRARRPAAVATAARSTACRRRLARRRAGRTRVAARCPHHDAARLCSASMTAAPMARSSGSTTMCPSPPEHQVRQRLWRIVAKRCVVAAGAHRAADRVSAATTRPAS